jgi:hypothetical protein
MNIKCFWSVVLLVALPILLSVGMAAASGAISEQEPNDSFETATPVSNPGVVNASFDDHDDVEFYEDDDYFRFRGERGELILVTFEGTAQLVYPSYIVLYDAARNELARQWANGSIAQLSHMLPKDGIFYLAILGGNCYEGGLHCWGSYQLFLGMTGPADPFEPNNTMDEATWIESSSTIHAVTDPALVCDDLDYYRFYGRQDEHIVVDVDAASIGSGLNAILRLYGPDGSLLAGNDMFDGDDPRLTYTLPADGSYIIELEPFQGLSGCYDGFYRLKLDEVVHVSVHANGTVGGLAYQRGDILTYYRNRHVWELLFDASDVRLTANTADFEVLPDGDLLMTFLGSTKLPGLGLVKPQDVVRFDSTSLEDTTAGQFQMFLDGSDVDLTTGNEAIDALALTREGDVVVSTIGYATVQGRQVEAYDEDLLIFHAASLGPDTVGTWQKLFDGSDAGALKTDLTALWIDPYDTTYGDFNWYLTLNPKSTIDGTVVDPNDIRNLFCEDECAWGLEDFGLDEAGLTNKHVDGLSLGAVAP